MDESEADDAPMSAWSGWTTSKLVGCGWYCREMIKYGEAPKVLCSILRRRGRKETSGMIPVNGGWKALETQKTDGHKIGVGLDGTADNGDLCRAA